MLTIDMLDGAPIPKRGDIMQTNLGDRRVIQFKRYPAKKPQTFEQHMRRVAPS